MHISPYSASTNAASIEIYPLILPGIQWSTNFLYWADNTACAALHCSQPLQDYRTSPLLTAWNCSCWQDVMCGVLFWKLWAEFIFLQNQYIFFALAAYLSSCPHATHWGKEGGVKHPLTCVHGWQSFLWPAQWLSCQKRLSVRWRDQLMIMWPLWQPIAVEIR